MPSELRRGPALALASVVSALAACSGPEPVIDLNLVAGLHAVSRAATEGGAPPGSEKLNVTNSGTCDLALSARATTTDGQPWFGLSAKYDSQVDTILGAGKTVPITVAFTLMPNDVPLLAGSYVGSITFTGTCTTNGHPARGSPTVVAVNLSVAPTSASIATDTGNVVGGESLLKNEWTLGNATGAPLAGDPSVSAAAWAGGYVYFRSMGMTSNEVFQGRFDPVANVWSPAHAGIGGSGSEGAIRVAAATMIPAGQQLLMWTGVTDADTSQDHVDSYSPGTDTFVEHLVSGGPDQSVSVTAFTDRTVYAWASGTPRRAGGLYSYKIGENSWRALPAAPMLASGSASMTWTGTELLIFGGFVYPTGWIGDGAAFNPATATWRALPKSPLSARRDAMSFWTGQAFVVWGGNDANAAVAWSRDDGASYDPAKDRWTLLPPHSATGVPAFTQRGVSRVQRV